MGQEEGGTSSEGGGRKTQKEGREGRDFGGGMKGRDLGNGGRGREGHGKREDKARGTSRVGGGKGRYKEGKHLETVAGDGGHVRTNACTHTYGRAKCHAPNMRR